jgi:hypothetical protein
LEADVPKRVLLPLLALAVGFFGGLVRTGALSAAQPEARFLLPVEYAFSNACPGDVIVV